MKLVHILGFIIKKSPPVLLIKGIKSIDCENAI